MLLIEEKIKVKVGLALSFLAICVGVWWAFYPGLSGSYYSDDFLYRVFDIASSPFYFFINKQPLHSYAYRPIEFSILWCTQALYGFNTTFQHCLQIVIHLLIVLSLYKISKMMGFSKIAAIISAIYILLSQSSVHAVLSNDTISQQLCTLFGYLSIFILHKAFQNQKLNKFLRLFTMSVICYFIALFSKELSVGYLLFIICYSFYISYKNKTMENIAYILFPYILITVFYILIRQSIGISSGSFGSGRYDINIGLNNFSNILILLFQTALPFSSAEVFMYVKEKMLLSLIFPALFVISVVLIPLIGFYLEKRYKELFLLVALFVIVMSVAIAMNHVSELYAYQILPIFALYFGIGISSVYMKIKNLSYVRNIMFIWISIVFIINVSACHSKALLMKKQGEKASKLYAHISDILVSCNDGEQILFVNKTNSIEYSIFYRKEFNTLKDGLEAIAVINNKPNTKFTIISEDNIDHSLEYSNYYMLDENESIVSYAAKK